MIYFADDQGMTLYALARRVADGLYWDGSAYVAKSAIAWQSLATAMTETPIGNESAYTATISGLTSEDGHIFEVYEQLAASPDASDGPPYLLVDASISSRLASGDYTTPPTTSAIADAVLDEALSGHVTPGTTGKALSDILQDTGETIPGAIEEIAEAVDALNPSPGGFTQLITIQNSANGNPIEGAAVRYYREGVEDRATTNSAGVASIAVPAGTYTRTVIAGGFDGASSIVAVASNGAATVQLVSVSAGGTAVLPPGFAN